MQYTIHMDGWNILDRVHLTMRVREWQDGAMTDREPLLERELDIPGVGEDDLEQWARDALIALVEAL